MAEEEKKETAAVLGVLKGAATCLGSPEAAQPRHRGRCVSMRRETARRVDGQCTAVKQPAEQLDDVTVATDSVTSLSFPPDSVQKLDELQLQKLFV